jgi:hypothetical protein
MDEALDLPLLYWIPKLFTNSIMLIALPNAPLSLFPINEHLVLLAVKFEHQSSWDTSYSRSGVNQMWILKNYPDVLEYKINVTLLV